MKDWGVRGVRWAGRRLRGRFERKVLVLLYHRVADLDADPWALGVSPSHFAEQLAVVRQRGYPLRLQDAVGALLDGTLPRRSVVITFDDGYTDNLYGAKPALERYDVPATVFVTTGPLEQGREFWWDELERLLLQPGRLPERLQLRVNGSTYRRELAEAADYDEETSRRHRRWRAWEPAPSARQALYRAIWELLQPLPDGERRRALDELGAWAGAEPVCRPTHRALSLAEVSTLAEGGLIEVGAHTVTHPALAALPAASQRDEIGRSKARLEEILDRPVESFSYPFGRQGDYTAETVAIVREAAFSCACSNFDGAVTVDTDPFQLPRVYVHDWSGREFARQLSRWLIADG